MAVKVWTATKNHAVALKDQVLRTKCPQSTLASLQKNPLHRTLSAFSLICIGVGAVVGAGIFVIPGQAAAQYAGPSLTLSFFISALACFFTGLCYCELSAAIPISGSAYSFAYVALGEGFAWLAALCLLASNLLLAAATAVGWSSSLQDFLDDVGVTFPTSLGEAPFIVTETGHVEATGTILNLPAMLLLGAITVILSIGVKESARFNNAAVVVKLTVLLLFIGYGVAYATSIAPSKFGDNLSPFMPPNKGTYGEFGVSGVLRGAAATFFTYTGFDTLCAIAQEVKNPERNIPIGLIGTLIICTVLYVLVTFFLTGMMNYKLLDVADPVIAALIHVKAPHAMRLAVEIGALCGMTSVCVVLLLSTPRLIFTIASDGLTHEKLAAVHPTLQTPLRSTVAAGTFAALTAGLLPLSVLGELVSFGTLLVFSMVCLSVVRLRYTHPNFPRPFRVPFVPLIPILGILTCVAQSLSLPAATWRNYAVYVAIGFVKYLWYGRRRSRLHINAKAADQQDGDTVPCTDVVLETYAVETPQTSLSSEMATKLGDAADDETEMSTHVGDTPWLTDLGTL